MAALFLHTSDTYPPGRAAVKYRVETTGTAFTNPDCLPLSYLVKPPLYTSSLSFVQSLIFISFSGNLFCFFHLSFPCVLLNTLTHCLHYCLLLPSPGHLHLLPWSHFHSFSSLSQWWFLLHSLSDFSVLISVFNFDCFSFSLHIYLTLFCLSLCVFSVYVRSQSTGIHWCVYRSAVLMGNV